MSEPNVAHFFRYSVVPSKPTNPYASRAIQATVRPSPATRSADGQMRSNRVSGLAGRVVKELLLDSVSYRNLVSWVRHWVGNTAIVRRLGDALGSIPSLDKIEFFFNVLVSVAPIEVRRDERI